MLEGRICRRYTLQAINIRSNQLQAVLFAACKPELVVDAFKPHATTGLRNVDLLSGGLSPQARHGTKLSMWKEREVKKSFNKLLIG
jgi:hypothetical protein